MEYADIHNFDATMIQPEWHGWMHHMYDEVPSSPKEFEIEALVGKSDAIYQDHVGLTSGEDSEQVNQTQLRQRGYKVGSLKTGPDEPDRYYKQPGHPLSGKPGRFPIRE